MPPRASSCGRKVSHLELTDYMRMLRRHWTLILSLTLLGAVVSGLFSLSLAPTYTSHTKVFAAAQSSGSVAELQQGNSFTQARVASYAETAVTPLVLQPVIDSLGLEASPAELAGRVEAKADLNTVLITITVQDPSPVQAAAIAQATAENLITAVEQIETTTSQGESPVNLTIVTPATAPAEPSSPNTRLNVLLGILFGFLCGIGAALLRSTLDTRVRSEQDLRRFSDVALLGGVAFENDAAKKPLLTQAPTQSPRAEAFRQIRTNLQFAQIGHATKAILITSSAPGEGKTTSAVNLAIAMAQSGQSVVLVDGDLRRPRVSDYLGLERNAGLTTALIGRADIDELLQPWGEDELYVLTSGQIPPNPSELLGSEAMKRLVNSLESRFDAVIIDAPPLLPVTDAAVLSQQVGGVVLVIGSSKVKTADVQKSLAALDLVDADILGVVMNLLPNKGPDAYAYTQYAYDAPELRSDRGKSKNGSPSSALRPAESFDDLLKMGSSRAARRARPE